MKQILEDSEISDTYVEDNIRLALNNVGDFNEFSKAIKSSLDAKIKNTPYVSAKRDQLQKYSEIEHLYKQIASK